MTSRKFDDADTTTSPVNNSHTAKQVRIIAIVSGLLMAEYFLQSLYYQHLQQQHKQTKEGFMGWFDSSAVEVPKSDKYIADLDLETCKFPIYYDKSRFDFKLQDNLFVEPGNWRKRNKAYVGNEDAKVVYYYIKDNERVRQRIYEKNPELPPIQRNLTFIHIGKWLTLPPFDRSSISGSVLINLHVLRHRQSRWIDDCLQPPIWSKIYQKTLRQYQF